MKKDISRLKFFYVIESNGEGKASVAFYADKESAKLACDIETAKCGIFYDNVPEDVELIFDRNGIFLNPYQTIEDLKESLAFVRRGALEIGGADSKEKTVLKSLKLKLFYTVESISDNSAVVFFHEGKEAAQISCDIEEEHIACLYQGVGVIELEFDKNGVLLNPARSKAALEKELSEINRKKLLEKKEKYIKTVVKKLPKPPKN